MGKRLTTKKTLFLSAPRRKQKGIYLINYWKNRATAELHPNSNINNNNENNTVDIRENEISEAPITNIRQSDTSDSEMITSLDDSLADYEIPIEVSQSMSNTSGLVLNGRRIFNVEYLFKQMKQISCHKPFNCGFSDMVLQNESRKGYLCTYKFYCKMCNCTFILKNEETKGKKLNLDLVSSVVCTGQGYEQLAESSAIINMPTLSKDTFHKIQKHVEIGLRDIAWESMKEAALQEANIAREKGEVDQDGCPLITVVADGAWAKRSYKSNYNSLSGVASIIGFETKKVIFIGVRNSYCSICSKVTESSSSQSNDDSIMNHVCFKNWSKSATAMESDIICEGFKQSVAMYGVKYNKLIGDNDSSVISKIVKAMPYGPNLRVQKINCTNHICRGYGNRLRDITKKRTNDQGLVPVNLRKILDNNIQRLLGAVKGAIYFRSTEKKLLAERILLLKSDLKNSPKHVFGLHSQCAEYFCKGHTSDEINLVPDMELSGLWKDINSALNLLINQADSLIYNVNNNTAECYNSIVAKYIGGKRINYTLRGSYQARCHAAAATFNDGKAMLTTLQKRLIGASPGKYTKAYTQRKYKEKIGLKRRRLYYNRSTKRAVNSNNSEADGHYGIDSQPDISDEFYIQKKEEFLDNLKKTENIEINTIGQNLNHLWRIERLKRLTASSFGKVCKMRKGTSCQNFVKAVLYSTFSGNNATNYGVEKEPIALDTISKLLNVEINPAGLYIDEENPFLGASPDGLIANDGLVEVKCPFVACKLTPIEALANKKINFGAIINGHFQVKRNHVYYFQIQGQLRITRRNYCIFVFWTPHGILWEKIMKDNDFWTKNMEKKLVIFYDRCLLPELVDPRFPRNLPIRNPSRE